METLNGDWDQVNTIIWASWANQVNIWHRIVLECEHLQSIFAKSEVPIKKGVRLPNEIDIAIRAFGATVDGLEMVQCRNLFPQLRSMSTMKDRFRQAQQWSLTDDVVDVCQQKPRPQEES